MSSTVGANIDTADILTVLDFSSKKTYPGSGTTLYDIARPANTFSLIGTYSFSDYYMTASASDAKATGPASNVIFPVGLANITVEIWMRYTSASRGYVFQSKADNDNYTHITVSGGSVSAPIEVRRRNASGSHTTLNSQNGTNDGIWHHVLASFSPTTCSFYLDGRLVATDELGIDPVFVTATGPFVLFGDKSLTSNSYIGDLSVFRLYARALGAAEAKRGYQTGKVKFGL